MSATDWGIRMACHFALAKELTRSSLAMPAAYAIGIAGAPPQAGTDEGGHQTIFKLFAQRLMISAASNALPVGPGEKGVRGELSAIAPTDEGSAATKRAVRAAFRCRRARTAVETAMASQSFSRM
ncbi:hypothetical protein [Mesorhizobium sp. M1B.F.Ca.ET.045.04.1.1]|uniref:hypothetical protein n=1 Tax=Mesorhizobium sp. M1B.F.Ca.ET.045.04.1.1 TaxID=2493673 RepID=UPI000F757E81|nr:hypothetical protein [Mesorhizobium sp. M1B.F.Ca.ET.045.04.1.1]AZO32488.1 hypothetical protein EJ071_37645 [Mesorhizobium sp. M1B.F.Ca.ET.045.04.1.1]